MKLTQDNEVLAENKVLILYLLNKLQKPFTNDGLYRVVLSIVDMNYFYFQQFLQDLEEKRFITCFHQEGKPVYQITDTGKETLSLTSDMIPRNYKIKG